MKPAPPKDFAGRLLCVACWNNCHRDPREKPKVQVAAMNTNKLCECLCHVDAPKTKARKKTERPEQLTITAPTEFIGGGD
jgi:hypothetical protein